MYILSMIPNTVAYIYTYVGMYILYNMCIGERGLVSSLKHCWGSLNSIDWIE